MARLMSVALTEQAVVERRKTVTRRVGWLFAKPGDRLTLVRKAMGRKRRDDEGRWFTEPLVRLAEVEIVSVRREPLIAIQDNPGDVEAEGFPYIGPGKFIEFFCEHMKCQLGIEVTRIEWRYLDDGKEVDR